MKISLALPLLALVAQQVAAIALPFSDDICLQATMTDMFGAIRVVQVATTGDQMVAGRLVAAKAPRAAVPILLSLPLPLALPLQVLHQQIQR